MVGDPPAGGIRSADLSAGRSVLTQHAAVWLGLTLAARCAGQTSRNPEPAPEAVVLAPGARFTVLTPWLIRMEASRDRVIVGDDRATTVRPLRLPCAMWAPFFSGGGASGCVQARAPGRCNAPYFA